jgi:hypothetical protein
MSHAAAPHERWVAEAFATLPSQTLPPPGTATPMLLPARGIYTRRIGWSDRETTGVNLRVLVRSGSASHVEATAAVARRVTLAQRTGSRPPRWQR